MARVFFGSGIYFLTLHHITSALQSTAQRLASPPAAAAAAAAINPSVPSASADISSSSSSVSSRTTQPPTSVLRTSSIARADVSPAVSFLAGASARTLASSMMSPVAVVKTRAEFARVGDKTFQSSIRGMAHIYRTEGIAALYSGLIPTIIRDAPFSGIYFTAYSKINAWYVPAANRAVA